MDWSAGVLWIMLGALFLGSSGKRVATRKGLLYMDHVRYVWLRTICGLGVENVWHVDRVSPVGCILIQITATLRDE
jgi:hypothetical protein